MRAGACFLLQAKKTPPILTGAYWAPFELPPKR